MTVENQETTQAPELSPLESALAMEEQMVGEHEAEVAAAEEAALKTSLEDGDSTVPETPSTPTPSVDPKPAEGAATASTADSTKKADEADPFQAKFDDLLEKERGIRERETAVKTAEEGGLNIETMAALAKSNPLGFLEKFGIDYDGLTDSILDTHDTDPKVKGLEDRIAKFEKDANDRAIKDQQTEMQAQVNQYVTNLNTHIADSDYEMIKATDSGQLVVDTITAYYKENGIELDVDEACKKVEEHLVEHELPRIQRVLATQKGQTMFGKRDSNTEDQAPEVVVPTTKPSQTLSNKAATVAPKRKSGPLTSEDRLKRAHLIEAQLKRNT